MLAGLAWIEQRRRGPRPRARRGYAVLAGLLLAVHVVLVNHAIADVGAGVATVIGSVYVPFAAALAWVVLRERPGRRYLLMLPVVLLGVVLVLAAVILDQRPTLIQYAGAVLVLSGVLAVTKTRPAAPEEVAVPTVVRAPEQVTAPSAAPGQRPSATRTRP